MLTTALFRRPASLNNTESRYWDRLLLLRAAGQVAEFGAHRMTFLLGPDCRYTPDFDVLRSDGTLELHEVKGPFIRTGDDGMVKLRTAAARFPWFRWVLVQEGKDRRWTANEVVP